MLGCRPCALGCMLPAGAPPSGNKMQWLLAVLLTSSASALVVLPAQNASMMAPRDDHPHPPCCGGCPHGPCTACRTPGPVPPTCCPCLPPFPPEPACAAPENCTALSTPRGYGVGISMLDELLVFAGGFKGNAGLDAIDIYNTTQGSWSHARMSANRTLFAGAALGHVAIFGCGEGGGGGTADVLDVRSGSVHTVTLQGGELSGGGCCQSPPLPRSCSGARAGGREQQHRESWAAALGT